MSNKREYWMDKENIYLVIDESGNLHKNSKNRYFVIGGYLTNDSIKGRSLFKKQMKEYKKTRGLNLSEEVKGSSMSYADKVNFLEPIAEKYRRSHIFEPSLILVDKNQLDKPVEKVNILYNYFIKLLIMRLAQKGKLKDKNLIIKADARSIKVESLNSLEEYLQSEFYFSNTNVSKVMYLESHKREEIQLADLICNHWWRKFEKHGHSKKKDKSNIHVRYFPWEKFGI